VLRILIWRNYFDKRPPEVFGWSRSFAGIFPFVTTFT
jgi:hypothetical protein